MYEENSRKRSLKFKPISNQLPWVYPYDNISLCIQFRLNRLFK